MNEEERLRKALEELREMFFREMRRANKLEIENQKLREQLKLKPK